MKKLFNFLIQAKKEYYLSKEHYKLDTIFNPHARITREINPYPYIVIDNAFTQEFYASFCEYHASLLKRGLSETPTGSRYYPFTYVTGYLEKYGGYFYPPKLQEHPALDFFFSHTWREYIENLCETKVNLFISTTLHLHTANNPTGWVHTDNQEVFFDTGDALSNGMISQSNNRNYFSHATKRSIAVLFYHNNDTWKEGDGGETGIFNNPKENPTVKVSPVSNRLLIFPIHNKSYHAFLSNNVNRNALVQWFHKEERTLKKP